MAFTPFTIPIEIFWTFLAIALAIGITGIVLGVKKIAGSPFITIFAGIMIFAILVMTNNIQLPTVASNTDYATPQAIYQMDSNTGATAAAYSATVTVRAEKPANTNSLIYNKPISCILMGLDKAGSPAGTVTIGVFDNDARLLKSFGTIDVSTLSTSFKLYKFCVPNHDYWVIGINDYVGAMYTGTVTLNAFTDTTNPFDGTNTISSAYSSGAWSDATTSDMRMVLVYDQNGVTTTNTRTVYAFGLTNSTAPELTAYLLFLMGLFIFIGVMLQLQKW